MNSEEIGTVLAEAYKELRDSTVAAYNQACTLAGAKRAFKTRESEILIKFAADPKVLGPNAETRDAAIKSMMEQEVNNLSMAEQAMAEVSHYVDMARINVESARAQLRVLELANPRGER